MAEHSRRYSPSAFARRMACPASAQVEEMLPDEPSEYAEEGSAAHELAALCLTTDTDAAAHHGAIFNGYAATDEMAGHVQQYADYVRAQAKGHHLLIEQRVHFDHLAPGGFGTADAIIINAAERALVVADFKYGMGVRVDARNNAQAMLYALGACHTYRAILADLVDTVTIVIHQPRLDHVSEWTITLDELAGFAETVKVTVSACEADNPVFAPGEDQCRFCRARATCAARANAAVSAVAGEPVDFINFDSECVRPATLMSNDEIAALLPHLDEIANWVSAVKTYATEELENGREVSGYKLVNGRSLRRWSDDSAVVAALKKLRVTKAQMFDQKLISPAKAEKLLGKRFDKLADLVAKPPGKPTLARADDKRPAVQLQIVNFEQETA